MSTLPETRPRARNHFNLRAYLAGGAATTALIAAAILVFGSLAAYVAFNGLPVGGEEDGAGELVIDESLGAPEAAAATAAAAAAAGAVAATAAAPTPVPLPPGVS